MQSNFQLPLQKFKKALTGKKAAIYVGGAFKTFSLIKALRSIGMSVVLAGSQTGNKDDYVRLQKVTTCPMDKVAPSDITNLKNDGLALFQDNKEKIVKFIKMVMDEKYGAWIGFHKI